ncbi:MAG: hypothetical protein ACXWLR_00220 [Myxococcales bacterium]
MAATKSQGSNFGLFLAGATVLCAGVAYSASALGKVLLLAGAGILLTAAAGFLKIKPLEGETPLEPSPEAMKWIGAGVAALGWVVTLGGLHLVEGNGGRIAVSLVGIGVSLFGMLYVLPAAFNKTAFWKVPGKSARTVSVVAGRDSELSEVPAAMGGAK